MVNGKPAADCGVINMDISILVQSSVDGPGGNAEVVTEYAKVVKEAEVTSQRFDAPGKMKFTCIEAKGIGIELGSSVALSVDGVQMFKGYVFTAERNKDGESIYTAYDQLRYLKANASYSFEAMTLPQIIARIAADFGLKTGAMEDTGYAFPCLIKENESCLDIIFDALAQTIIQTGRIFAFYDQAGELRLTEARNMYVNTLLGDASLVTDYTYKRDIDANTYNRIKLVRANSQTGRADVYMHEDRDTIKKWGLLQYYDQVDENMNEAQIDQMCAQYLQYYNRVIQTITLETIGVPQIRAGMIVPVRIGAVGDLKTTRLLLTEKVTHKFEQDVHTMRVEVKDFSKLGGMILV